MNARLFRCFGLLGGAMLTIGMLCLSACNKFNGQSDLVGGTAWVYELDLSDFHGDAHDLPQRVIEVLERRVDPHEIQNILWHAVGVNRIEVQMPPASPAILAARKELHDAQDAARWRQIWVLARQLRLWN